MILKEIDYIYIYIYISTVINLINYKSSPPLPSKSDWSLLIFMQVCFISSWSLHEIIVFAIDVDELSNRTRIGCCSAEIIYSRNLFVISFQSYVHYKNIINQFFSLYSTNYKLTNTDNMRLLINYQVCAFFFTKYLSLSKIQIKKFFFD